MMTKLPLSVPLAERETVFSYLNRLAAANGVSAKDFCMDLGMSLSPTQHGHPIQTERLAALGGVDHVQLAQWTPRRHEGRGFQFAGHSFSSTAFTVSTVRGCPDCLKEGMRDIAAGSSNHLVLRGDWQLKVVTLCHRHTQPLISLWTNRNTAQRNDVGPRFKEVSQELLNACTEHGSRLPTGFDLWLEDRFAGIKSQSWLDRLRLPEAIDLCVWLGGLLAAQGENLATGETWKHASIGHEIASRGPDAVRQALRTLQGQYGPAPAGPFKILGPLYTNLASKENEETRPGLRRFVRKHIVNHWPYGPGDSIFCEPVNERHIHSVLTAARSCRIGTKRMRKLLSDANLVPPEGTGPEDGAALFKVEDGASLLKEISYNVPTHDLQDRFGISKSQIEILQLDGFLAPKNAAKDAKPTWNIEETAIFLGKLFDQALDTPDEIEGWESIPQSAQNLKIRPGVILVFLQQGRLARLKKLPGCNHYSELRVQTERVQQLLDDRTPQGISLRTFLSQTRIASKRASELVHSGHIKTFVAPNPITHVLQFRLPPGEMERFLDRYISASKLRRFLDISRQRAKKQFLESGICPWRSETATSGNIFEWSEIEAKLVCRWPRIPPSNGRN